MEEAIRFLLEAKLNGGDQALDQSQLRQSITAQLLDLRSQLSSLLFENHEAAKSLKNGVHARLREAHNEHADLSRLLHSLTVKRDQKASFTFSKGARAILEERGLLEPSASQQQQQQQQHRTAEDREVHGQKLLALQQEKEERLTLMRQMNALENEKQAQQRKIKELNRYLGGLPALVDKLSKHLEPMTRAPFDVPPSAVPLPESFFNVLDPRLRRMFARLSAYLVEAFLCEPQIRGLFLVSCCWHHLGNSWDPMSQFFKAHDPALDRRALIVSCHSSEKENRPGCHQMNAYRSMLHALLLRAGVPKSTLPEVRTGGVRGAAPRKSFAGYVQHVGSKLKGPVRIQVIENDAVETCELVDAGAVVVTTKFLAEFTRELYSTVYHKTMVIWSLRNAFAPVLESLFLLDRAMRLLEVAGVQVEVFPLFDPKISPRCIAIQATKTL